MLAQHLAKPLHDAAMGLTIDHRLMNDDSDVVDRRVAHDGDNTRLRIDLDLADMAAVRKRHLRRGKFADGIEAALQFFRKIVRLPRALRQVEDRNPEVGTRHHEGTPGKLNVADCNLEQMRCDPATLFDCAVAGNSRGAARHHQ